MAVHESSRSMSRSLEDVFRSGGIVFALTTLDQGKENADYPHFANAYHPPNDRREVVLSQYTCM